MVGLLLLLLLIPAGIRLRWDGERLVLKAVYGPVRIDLSPHRLEARRAKKERRAARKKPKSPKEAKKKEPEEAAAGPKKKWTLSGIWSLLKSSGRVLRKLCRHVVIRRLRVQVELVRPDAHQTALTYAKLCAIAPLLLEVLGELFTLKKPAVRIRPDFAGSRTRCTASVAIQVRPLFLLAAGVRLLLVYLKRPTRPQKESPASPPSQRRKGGKQHEPTAASHQ